MHPTESTAGDIPETAIEALGTLASEHRIAILRELAVADEPLAFSELRERVGIRDTGRFNYHLSKLRERFVRETDGKYELGHAGERVVLATTDLDADGAATLAKAHGTDENGECAVCGEEDCNRVIHVHLSGA
ncbi:helix-turn-helix domain-containing protein [Haladaptatus pallidirubidus]|uniref:DUF7347 domain-containing protein n=1 Tax=Haladaptatus pallidirubidus TaxID=1008152 RepID=A0AAV3UCE7_9EURY|nr:helix-turn-helix domain-containing protein [Haladaptatus pallidirubidus]